MQDQGRLICNRRRMTTDFWPVRRLRQKTCVPVGAAVLAQQLPHGSHSLSRVSDRTDCQGPRLDISVMFHSFMGTDVIATVASFLTIRALGRFLCLETHVYDNEGLWNILLRSVSRSVFALSTVLAPSVRSARASISKMMRRPSDTWPADAHGSCGRLSNYRWCLDLCYCEYQMFSAVIPVKAASDENDIDIRSLIRDDFAGGERIANLLSASRLRQFFFGRMANAWSFSGRMANAWNGTTDTVLHSRRRSCDLQPGDEFRRDKVTCSLCLFDLGSREVVTGICRDARWGSASGLFRFYIEEEFECDDLCDSWDSDTSSEETQTGRVLEIWVPFKCSCNGQGNYDLSCSVEVFVAEETVYPGGVEWKHRRAVTWDLVDALRLRTLTSAVPDIEV